MSTLQVQQRTKRMCKTVVAFKKACVESIEDTSEPLNVRQLLCAKNMFLQAAGDEAFCVGFEQSQCLMPERSLLSHPGSSHPIVRQ
jgi:hypothetical protein